MTATDRLTNATQAGEPPRPLLLLLDDLEWNRRSVADVVREVQALGPVWIRVSNFFDRTLELLRLLEPPSLVAWRIEYWGSDPRYADVPSSLQVDPEKYASAMVSSGHTVVPYTFNAWGRDSLTRLAPCLNHVPFGVLPLAQKIASPTNSGTVAELRSRIGVGPNGVLVGAGGLLHPAKGILEIVDGFVRSFPGCSARLLCSLVVEDDMDAADVKRGFEAELGADALRRVHVRVGRYSEWEWMCLFYRSIDLLCVNSVSDSWGRMVSEAVGLGVPTLVREADCGTNHVLPGIVRVPSFADMGSDGFLAAARLATSRAAALSALAEERYGLSVVRRRWTEWLRRHTPPERRALFESAVGDPLNLARLDEAIVF